MVELGEAAEEIVSIREGNELSDKGQETYFPTITTYYSVWPC